MDIITELQNHGTIEIGRDLCRSPSPTPWSKWDQLSRILSSAILNASKILHNLFRKHVPESDHPYKEKNKGFFLQWDFGIIQILIKTYENTQNFKIKSEQRKYLLFKKLVILSSLLNSYVWNNDSIMYPEAKYWLNCSLMPWQWPSYLKNLQKVPSAI